MLGVKLSSIKLSSCCAGGAGGPRPPLTRPTRCSRASPSPDSAATRDSRRPSSQTRVAPLKRRRPSSRVSPRPAAPPPRPAPGAHRLCSAGGPAGPDTVPSVGPVRTCRGRGAGRFRRPRPVTAAGCPETVLSRRWPPGRTPVSLFAAEPRVLRVSVPHRSRCPIES